MYWTRISGIRAQAVGEKVTSKRAASTTTILPLQHKSRKHFGLRQQHNGAERATWDRTTGDHPGLIHRTPVRGHHPPPGPWNLRNGGRWMSPALGTRGGGRVPVARGKFGDSKAEVARKNQNICRGGELSMMQINDVCGGGGNEMRRNAGVNLKPNLWGIEFHHHPHWQEGKKFRPLTMSRLLERISSRFEFWREQITRSQTRGV